MERGDTEAVPRAVRRQLAQRCVRPIFSFPFAHLSQKELPEPVQTGRLQHPSDNSQQAPKEQKSSSSAVPAATGSEKAHPPNIICSDYDVASYKTHDPHVTKASSAAMEENCEFLVSVSRVLTG